MHDILSDGVMEDFTHVRRISQSSQHCKLIPYLCWRLGEVFDDIADLCDIVGEDQTANQYDKSKYDPFVDVVDNDVSKSHSRHYAG